MSVYEVWQQEIYAGVTGMTDSQHYQVPENETTVSHLVDVANPQHMFWKYLIEHSPHNLIWSCFVFLFYFFIVLCLLATMLKKRPVQNAPEQDDDVKSSNKDLASKNARLARENTQMGKENTQLRKELVQAQEDASVWQRNYNEERARVQPDSTRWRRMYHETHDENAKLRKEYARTRAQDAKNVTEKARIERKRETEKAKEMAEMQTKLDLWNRHVGQLEGHNERLKQKLSDQTEAIKNVDTMIAAHVKIQDEQYTTITSLKSEKARHVQKITELKFKLSTIESHQDAAIKAAVEAAMAKSNEERSSSIVRSKRHRGVMMPKARRLLAKNVIVKGIQSGGVSKPKRNIVAAKLGKAAALTKGLSHPRGMRSQQHKVAAKLTRALSALNLNGMQSEKGKIAAGLTKASSDLSQMPSEKGEIAENSTTASSDLNRTQSEKEKVEADLTKASSDIIELQREKENIAADLTKASSDLSQVRSEKGEIAESLTTASSDLHRTQTEKEKVEADLTKASSDLGELQKEKEKIEADLTKASSDLSELKQEKEKIATDLTKASSDLGELQQEKEKIATDLTKALSDLRETQSEKKDIAADLEKTNAELKTKIALTEQLQRENQALRSHVCDHTHCQQQFQAQAAETTQHLQRENQALRSHVCDHAHCQQQFQAQAAETTEALRYRNQTCLTLRESNNAHEKTKANLYSTKRDLETLRKVHSQCKQGTQPQDKMDVVEPADELADADNMDVDTPQQVLIDRLELAQQQIDELKGQNEKLREVMQGNRDRGDSASAAAEERIREKVLYESKEERGALLRRIEDQKDDLRKKDEALKNNNVSQRLQDELKAAKEKASKLEYDISTLRRDDKPKPSGASTAPMQNGANETIQRLKFDLKRLNKETKEAKASYDRVDKVLFKRDQKACEDLRNVEKVRGELGAEVERLQKKIERLEAGVRDEPPPAPIVAPAPGVSASGKRAWDGEGGDEMGREAVKKLRE